VYIDEHDQSSGIWVSCEEENSENSQNCWY